MGFLIARLTFKLSTSGPEWTYIAQEDLRGQIPPISAGVSVTTTDHALLANLTFALAGHTGFQAQGDVLDDLNTTGAVGGDSEFLVGTGAGALAWENAATAATSMGLGTGDSPQFTAINLGHASDTTLTRVSAGVVAIEGTTIMMIGDAPTAHTIASHSDTTGTGAELNTLTDGSETALHSHAGGGGSGYLGYIKLVDSKAAGTHGGTATSGSWQKRTVTEETDTNNDVSVSSSVIVLDAGVYECSIFCSAEQVGGHQARLRNTTDSSTILVGTMERSVTGTAKVGNKSFIVGRFTIGASKNVEIQHRVQVTVATAGWGAGLNLGEVHIYTIAEFWRVS
jgi:hypothetical protein